MAPAFPDLHLVLARQLERAFDRLRPATGKVDRTALKMRPGESQQFRGVRLGYRRGELGSMDELQLAGLLAHGRDDFGDSMADEVDGSRTGKIQVTLARAVPNVYTLAPNRRGEFRD